MQRAFFMSLFISLSQYTILGVNYKMKKALIATLAAAMLATSALGLAACSKKDGGTTEPGTTPDPTPTPKTYTVTFDAQGGTVTPASATTGTDGKLTSLPTPTKDDNTFDGWYTAASAGDKVTVTKVYTQNTTIYAHWTTTGDVGGGGDDDQQGTAYTVKLDGNGGELVNGIETVTTGTDGKLAELPATPTRVGYEFKGWYDAAEAGTKIETTTVFTENNKTIYAQWTEVLQDTGTGIYVGATLVAALEDNSENIADPEDPTTQGKADQEFMATGVTLSAGQVLTVKIDGKQLTHAAQELELWSSECHGVSFNQAAGTFTVKPGDDRPFSIYVRHFTEAERQKGNPSDKGDCWSVQITDGIAEVLEEGAYYLIGSMTDWNLDASMKIGDEGLVYEFTTDMEFKARQYNAGQTSSQGWVDQAASQDNITWTTGGNAKVTEAGSYKVTIVGGKFQLEKA